MKNYQKAEMIAKNLPTGSYAAGCPTNGDRSGGMYRMSNGNLTGQCEAMCRSCEITM